MNREEDPNIKDPVTLWKELMTRCHDASLDEEFMYHFRHTKVKDDPGDAGRRINKADALARGLIDTNLKTTVEADEIFSCQLEKELYDWMVINRISGGQGKDLLKIIKNKVRR